MKQYLLEYDVLLGIAAFCCFCMALQSITAYIYIRLIHESKKISQTKNRWLRSFSARFEACYQLRIPPKNPKILVQNGIYHYEFMGVSLVSWRNLCRQCNGLVVVLSACNFALGSYYEMSKHWFIVNGISTSVWLVLLFVYSASCHMQKREEILCCHILDYLENTLMPRLENEYLHEEETRAYRREYFDDGASDEEEGYDESEFDEDSYYSYSDEIDEEEDDKPDRMPKHVLEGNDKFDKVSGHTVDKSQKYKGLSSDVKKKMEKEYGQAASLIQEIAARMAEEEKQAKRAEEEKLLMRANEEETNKNAEIERTKRMLQKDKTVKPSAKQRREVLAEGEKAAGVSDREKIAATKEALTGNKENKRGVRVDMDELLKQVEREKGKSVISSVEQLELLEEVIREYL